MGPTPLPTDGRELLAAFGASCALASLALPYATLSGAGLDVQVAASLGARSPLLALPVLVVAGALLSLFDTTRGEQVLGLLFAALLVATVLGPLVVPDLSGWPEPGLWLLLAGWVLVDAADDLALSNPRAERRVVLGALTSLLVAGSAFLYLHRVALTGGWTTPLLVVWLATGAVALGSWITAFVWEWTAEA